MATKTDVIISGVQFIRAEKLGIDRKSRKIINAMFPQNDKFRKKFFYYTPFSGYEKIEDKKHDI